jgi:hypothetical protein
VGIFRGTQSKFDGLSSLFFLEQQLNIGMPHHLSRYIYYIKSHQYIIHHYTVYYIYICQCIIRDTYHIYICILSYLICKYISSTYFGRHSYFGVHVSAILLRSFAVCFWQFQQKLATFLRTSECHRNVQGGAPKTKSLAWCNQLGNLRLIRSNYITN